MGEGGFVDSLLTREEFAKAGFVEITTAVCLSVFLRVLRVLVPYQHSRGTCTGLKASPIGEGAGCRWK